MSENNENFDFKKEYGDKLLDHDYDGIMELDNPAPKWVLAIWYVTIAFSLVYGIYYFAMDGPTQIDEYNTESAEVDAMIKKAEASDVKLELLTDDASLTEGAKLYKEMACSACHGAKDAIGPNLADNNWIYSCKFPDVMDVIKKGKSQKSMPPFGKKMSKKKIQKLVSYIMTNLKKEEIANPKEPQGKACE